MSKQQSKKQERTAENIQVVVRCRPMNKNEIADRQTQVCYVNEKDKEVVLQMKSNKCASKSFYYDAVYGTKSTQRDVYMGTVFPIVQEVLEGYNCTLFAYGQTGTGKTYTMEGSRDDPSKWSSTEAGIIARSINTIFESLAKYGDDYSVKVSHLELYNEELCDLLNPENKSLKIYEDPGSSTSTITVHNLTEIPVYKASDIFNILEKSWDERKTAETDLNDASSRSHCIFSITICMRETTPEGEELLKIGKLNLVDLAGSENIAKSGAKSQTKTEAGMINKSLLTLGRVITALTEHSPHIPYRESKLTRLLQDSLGGTTKTCIIATVSPAVGGSDETLSTLDYASRAKNIRNQPQVNKKISKKEVLKEFTTEIADLKAQLDAARRKDGVYLPNDQYAKILNEIEEKAQRIGILEDSLETKQKEFVEIQELYQKQGLELDRMRTVLEETNDSLQKQTESLQQTEVLLESTQVELKETQIVLAEVKETEQQFHAEAKIVLETLNSAVTDIHGLHLKIERQDSLSENNTNNLDEFRANVIEKILSTRAGVTEFITTQKSKYSAISNQLLSLIENNRKQIEQQQIQISTNNKSIVDGLSKLDNINTTTLTNAETYQRQISKYQKQRNDSFATKTSSFIELFKGNKNMMEQDISLQEISSKNSTQMGVGSVSETEKTIKQFMENHEKDLTKLFSSVSGNISSGLDKLYEHCGLLSQFVSVQKDVEQKYQSELQELILLQKKQMQDLIDQQTIAREQQNSRVISQMKEQITGSISGFLMLSQNIKESNVPMQSQINNFGVGVSEKLNGLCSFMTEAQDSSSQFLAKMSSNLNETEDSLEKEIQTFKEALSVDALTNDKLLKESVDSLKVRASEHSNLLGFLKQQTEGNTNQVLGSIKSMDISTSEMVKNCIEELRTSSVATVEFASSQHSSHDNLHDKFRTFKYKPYLATTTTPLRKNYQYPSQLPHSRSDSEILSQYRPSNSPMESVSELQLNNTPETNFPVGELELEDDESVVVESDSPKDLGTVTSVQTSQKSKARPSFRRDVPSQKSKVRVPPKLTANLPPQKPVVASPPQTGRKTHNRKASLYSKPLPNRDGSSPENSVNMAVKTVSATPTNSNSKDRQRLVDLTNQVKS